MKRLPQALVVICVALSACGGGAGRSPAPNPAPVTLVGTFGGGPVQGLRYRTASQSGFTDSMGRFNYRAGETVEFFVGGVRLGAAAGATTINLFSLFTTPAPTTEAALRAELVTHDNVTNFDRVANIARFLVALDNDHDPANGLDVTGWDARLTTARLSFDVPMSAFASTSDDAPHAFSRFARRQGINGHVPWEMPVAQLYRSAGIAVPVLAQVHESRDEDNDGVPDAILTTTFDNRGRRILTGDDFDADGINNSVYREMYRADGRLESSINEDDIDEDGIADQRFSSNFTYDPSGNSLVSTHEADGDADGAIEQRQVSRSTFDASGRRLLDTYEEDDGADGIIESRETRTYDYDTANNPIRVVSETDSDNDGRANSRTTTVNTHDLDGRTLTISIESDFDADGDAEFRRTIGLTYDSAGNLVARTEETDNDGDRVIDARRTGSASWDGVGNLLTTAEERDFDGDGRADSRQAGSWSYDASGNVLTQAFDRDFDGDNVFDSRETTTFTYDATGSVLTRVQVTDSASTTADVRHTVTNEYGPSGALRRSTTTTDFDGDGVVDSTSVIAYSQAQINDGIEYLLTHFRDID